VDHNRKDNIGVNQKHGHALRRSGILLAVAFIGVGGLRATALNFFTIDDPAGTDASVYGINSSGEIVGQSTAGAFFGSLGGLSSLSGAAAWGINDSGVIVGYNSGFTSTFIYDNGAYRTLRMPGEASTLGSGINDSGQIVGTYRDSTNLAHGFLYSGGVFTTIDVPGARWTDLEGINNKDQMVGLYSNSSGIHGFLYDAGNFTTIDAPCVSANNCDTELFGINDNGEIVGGALVAPGLYNGLIYDDSSLTLFAEPNAGTNSWTFAFGVNDADQIVGEYGDVNNEFHGFLATPSPTPDPPTAFLLITGLLCVASFRWMRTMSGFRVSP
jgi:probable HAF family extracellular repeat protein